MKTIIFFVKFLLLGALFIVSNDRLDLKEEGAFDEFSGMYYDWLEGLFNTGKSVTGFVITDVDWLPRIESDPSLVDFGKG